MYHTIPFLPGVSDARLSRSAAYTVLRSNPCSAAASTAADEGSNRVELVKR